MQSAPTPHALQYPKVGFSLAEVQMNDDLLIYFLINSLLVILKCWLLLVSHNHAYSMYDLQVGELGY